MPHIIGPSVATHEKILVAAEAALSRYTLSKFSMEDVAKRAGIARQTIYTYFPSRDDLLIALFVREMETNHAPVLAELISREPSPRTLLDILLTELRLARRYEYFNELLDPAAAPHMAELVFSHPALAEAREDIWTPILRRYLGAGILRADLDFAATTRWITYQEFWLMAHPTVLCEDDDLPYFVAEFVLKALLAPGVDLRVPQQAASAA